MRIQMLFGSSIIAAAALVGCGGDDTSVRVPDAKKFMDAAPDAPHLCGIDMASLGNLSFGSMTAPVRRNCFDSITQGADMGKKEFFIAARLSMGTTPPIDALIIDVPQPGTAATPAPWATNTPYAFETDATSTGAIVADAYLFGDFDGMQTVQNIYWAQQGTITFSKFDTPKAATSPTATDGSQHFGTVSMVPFKEIDQDTGEVLAGGCSTSLGGLNFFVTQSEMALPRLDPASDADSDPKLEAAINKVKELKAARQAASQQY